MNVSQTRSRLKLSINITNAQARAIRFKICGGLWLSQISSVLLLQQSDVNANIIYQNNGARYQSVNYADANGNVVYISQSGTSGQSIVVATGHLHIQVSQSGSGSQAVVISGGNLNVNVSQFSEVSPAV